MIIIIAILASIVLIKIHNLRADAYNIAQYNNFRTLVNDLNTYYVSRGDYFRDENGVNFHKMTNYRAENPYYYVINSSDNKPCFLITLVKNDLYVQFANNPKSLSGACKKLNETFLAYNIDFNKDEYKSLLISNKK